MKQVIFQVHETETSWYWLKIEGVKIALLDQKERRLQMEIFGRLDVVYSVINTPENSPVHA